MVDMRCNCDVIHVFDDKIPHGADIRCDGREVSAWVVDFLLSNRVMV